MSLYNALFGVNPFSNILLEILQTNMNAIPRYRDCFLNDSGEEIVIHTRTGGGNRSYYETRVDENADYPGPFNEDLRKIIGYKYDKDDDFDCTYANFYYEIPEEFKTMVATLRTLGASQDPAAKWQTLFEDLKRGDKSKPEVQRALAVGEKITAQIKDVMKK